MDAGNCWLDLLCILVVSILVDVMTSQRLRLLVNDLFRRKEVIFKRLQQQFGAYCAGMNKTLGYGLKYIFYKYTNSMTCNATNLSPYDPFNHTANIVTNPTSPDPFDKTPIVATGATDSIAFTLTNYNTTDHDCIYCNYNSIGEYGILIQFVFFPIASLFDSWLYYVYFNYNTVERYYHSTIFYKFSCKVNVYTVWYCIIIFRIVHMST